MTPPIGFTVDPRAELAHAAAAAEAAVQDHRARCRACRSGAALCLRRLRLALAAKRAHASAAWAQFADADSVPGSGDSGEMDAQ